MILCSDNKEESIYFDLKIKTDCFISKLKNILIKLGISCLKKTDFYDSDCFYIYTHFEMNITQNQTMDSIELDKLDGRYYLF